MNKFLQNLKTVAEKLGLTSKLSARTLTAEDNDQIAAEYDKAFGEGSFNQDYAEFKKDCAAVEKAKELSDTFNKVADMLGVSAGTEGTDAPDAQTQNAVVEAVDKLTAAVNVLGGKSAGDAPKDIVPVTVTISGKHTDKFAFGIQHPMFDAAKRWNRLAITHVLPTRDASAKEKEAFRDEFAEYCEAIGHRINELAAAGNLQGLKVQDSMTVTGLNSDNEIGTYRYTIRQDALIARIIALPSLAGIFDKISNVQAGQVITNVLFTEVSQAYQAGHVYKGSVSFVPEKAKVHKAMAKIQFTDMSELEKSYLNYLNRSGANPVKWNMIEWLLLHISTKIANEKLVRAIRGRRVEPTANVAGIANLSADGIIGRLLSFYDANKMLPFTEGDCNNYDKTNIGDVLIYMAGRISELVDNPKDYVFYVNENHKPLMAHWYNTTYGSNANYNGDQINVVPEYDNKIVWVPGMGNLQFIFATVEGNITLLEGVPGEEFRFEFQRDLESVVAFSYWNEGVGAGYVGKEFSSRAALVADDCKSQMLFMNWPAVDVDADATSLDADDAKAGQIFQLPNDNTANKALTDIAHAKDGETYRIIAPATAGTYKTTIAKSGKFADLKSAVDFSSDKFLDVAYDKTNDKFIEVARG